MEAETIAAVGANSDGPSRESRDTENSSHNLTIQLVWEQRDIQSQQKGLIDRVFNGVVIHLIKSWWSYLPFLGQQLLVPKAEWSGNGEAELLKNFKLSERSLKGGGVSCRPILQEYGHKKSFWKSPERRASVKNQIDYLHNKSLIWINSDRSWQEN